MTIAASVEIISLFLVRIFDFVPFYYIMTGQPFDQQAAALLMKYYRFVFWQVRRIMPFPDLAEDVAQQVFVEFLSHTERWDLNNDLRPVMTTLIRRCAAAVWRDRAKLLPDALRRIAEFVQQEQSDTPADGYEEQISTLRRCLQKLPEGGRQLLVRHYFDGIPTKQIAAELSKKAGAVGKAIYRLREKLRLCME